MIAALLALALAAPVRFDRVDLLSEASGTWLHDEAGRLGATPTVVALRYVEQIQPVIALPPEGLQVGLSLRTQTVRFERRLDGQILWNAGLQMHAGLPNGAVAGLAWRRGVVRIGGSVSVVSAATWARPAWTGWRALPTIGLGLGPVRKGGRKAPWMKPEGPE